jgi:hypothetical protein
MPYKSSVCAILFLLPLVFTAHDEFIFNGFNGDAGWAIDGSAAVLTNGVRSLVATNSESYNHAHARTAAARAHAHANSFRLPYVTGPIFHLRSLRGQGNQFKLLCRTYRILSSGGKGTCYCSWANVAINLSSPFAIGRM